MLPDNTLAACGKIEFWVKNIEVEISVRQKPIKVALLARELIISLVLWSVSKVAVSDQVDRSIKENEMVQIKKATVEKMNW